MTDHELSHSGSKAQQTAEKQRDIQERQKRLDVWGAENADCESLENNWDAPHGVVYPRAPVSTEELKKPGKEETMNVQPHYLAPHYQGSAKLQGQVALITGGDSGIGRSVAVLMAREGATVAIIYLSSTEDAEVTQQAVKDEGGECLLIQGDVKDPKFCAAAVEHVVAQWRRLDILVNNAAFQQHAHAPEQLDMERWEETFSTNMGGYFNMVKAALAHMQTGSCIINTGSVVGLKGSAQLLDYASSKGAIHAFTYSLAANLASRKIRVNAVAPGPVWTPLNPADRDEAGLEQFGKDTVYKRPAQPEELAPAYVFLASPQCSSYITGIVLPITGTPGDH